MSPILFILYVNDMLNTIQQTGGGLTAICIPQYHSVAGIMFVDDLHVMANSITGLANIINTLITEGIKDDLIINLDKSTLQLTKPQETALGGIIKDYPVLTLFKIKNRGTYLGVVTRPKNIATYHHIQARMAKATSALQQMQARGLSQHNVGRKTVRTIIITTLIPLLTYALEAFPLSPADYNTLDRYIADAISNTTPQSSTDVTWTFSEISITPPSLLIQRNKLNLYIKATLASNNLNKHLIRSFPNNFLQREVTDIAKEWSINLSDLLSNPQLTEQKIKQTINKALDTREQEIEKIALTILNWEDPANPPQRIPDHIVNPSKEIFQLRDRIIHPQRYKTCNSCHEDNIDELQHNLQLCMHPTKVLKRQELSQAIRDFHPELDQWMQQQTPRTQLTVLSGLTSLNDEQANKFLIECANSTTALAVD